MQRRSKIRLLTAEIKVQPAFCTSQRERFLFAVVGAQGPRKILLTVEPKSGQTLLVCGQQDAAQRGVVVDCVHHRFAAPFLFARPLLYWNYNTISPESFSTKLRNQLEIKQN